MKAALARVFLASLIRRPLATALSLIAIALGVALGLAVDLLHDAALDELDRGMRTLSGRADLQVVGPRSGFDEAVYLALAPRPELREASPVVEVEAKVAATTGALTVLGVDVFRMARLQPALLPSIEGGGERFALLDPHKVFLSPAALARLGVGQGDRLPLLAGSGTVALEVAGSLPGAGMGQVLAVMDIAAVQQHFGLVGRLTRIDLRLAPGIDRVGAATELQRLLPAGVTLTTPEATRAQEARLSRAYRVNLLMLAVIALVTGGFLVFSTQWLAVVRRQRELAFLRTLGLERRRLVAGLLAEGAAIGLAGGVLGLALGYALAAILLALVGGDLGAGYFEGLTPELRPVPLAMAAFLSLGVLAGLLGAALPARHAANQAPARGVRAADQEGVPATRVGWWAPPLTAAAAAGLCQLPPIAGVPLAGYAAIALILVAAMLTLPGATRLVTRALRHARAPLLRLAHGRLSSEPGQVLVAGAGMAASVALAAAMAIMVGSFRDSVDAWLGRALPADLYVRSAAGLASGYFDAADPARAAAVPGVAGVDPVRHDHVRLAEHLPAVALIARPVPGPQALPLVEHGVSPGNGESPPRDTALDPVWISEAMVDLYGLGVGDRVDLPLGGRTHGFVVAGVWRDYVRQHGAMIVDLGDYRRLSGDQRIDDLAVHLGAEAEAGQVAAGMRRQFGEQVVVAEPGEIRARTLAIFDRTFFVTYLMEAAAVAIGLFGVATTFAGLATARRREFGVLRHLGLTRAEVGRLLAIEGALCGAVAVMVGLVAGAAIALILVEVVNRQSFHWSMDFRVPVAALAGFALLMVGLAAAAARTAAGAAMRRSAVLAVREDW